MSFEKISDSLNIKNSIVKPEKAKEELITIENHNEEIETDYKLSRKTYKGMIEEGEAAINKLAKIADESDQPRAFEVLATLIKTVSDTTEKLLILQKDKTELLKIKDQPEKVINNQNLFVGSTAEFLELLDKEKDDNKQ